MPIDKKISTPTHVGTSATGIRNSFETLLFVSTRRATPILLYGRAAQKPKTSSLL